MDTTSARKEFQHRLDAAMIKAGVNQTELAEVIERSQATISDWLSDADDIKRAPRMEQLAAVAKRLSVRPSWLAFGDDFEPMDDEEVAVLHSYRKLSEEERIAFATTFHAITKERQTMKNPGRKTRRSPHASRVPSLQEFLRSLPPSEEVERVNADLLEHESVLPVGSKAELSVERASTLLSRLIEVLRCVPQLDLQSGSSASLPKVVPGAAKPKRGRTRSDQPLLPPTDEKK